MQPYINLNKGWGSVATKLLATVVLLVVLLAPLQVSLEHTPHIQPLTTKAQAGVNPNAYTAPIGPTPSGAPLPAQSTSQPPASPPSQSPMDSTEICNGSSASTCIGSVIYLFTVGLMSIFAYIGGYVFSFAVQLTLQSVTYSLDFLTSGWTAVRDIANMAFIFILIYIAVSIIFKAETSGTMTMLAWVVVMALLINFSFFLTRVVVDAGNILAVQFYNAIPAQPFSQTTGGLAGPIASGVGNLLPGSPKDLTAGIMNALQIQNALGVQSFDLITSQSGVGVFMVNLIAKIFIYVAVGAMLAILAFTFLTVGFKFLIRIIILWFVIIAAPLAFAARAIPTRTAKDLYDKWFGLLINFSFYPAIFLFIFLIITFITQTVASTGLIPTFSQNNLAAGASAASFAEGSPLYTLGTAVAHIVIRMGLIITMLFYGLKLSERLATEGNNMAQSMTGWVGGKVAGSTSWMARRTVGATAQTMARSKLARNLETRMPFVGGNMRRGLKGIANARMDMRNAPGLKQGASALGVSWGTPGKGGYTADVDARAKLIATRAKDLNSTEVEKFKAQRKYDSGEGKKERERLTALKEEKEKLAKERIAEAETLEEAGDLTAARDQRGFAAGFTKEAAAADKEIKQLGAYAEEKIKKEDSARINKYASKYRDRRFRNIGMPSRGSIKGALDALKKKSTHEKAHELLKEMDEEHAAEAGHTDDHDPHPPTPGGGHPSGGGGGGHAAPTPAATHNDTHAHPPKAAPKGGDHGHGHGTHSFAEREISDLAEAVHKNTDALKKMTRGLSRHSERPSYNGLVNRSEIIMDSYRPRATIERGAAKTLTANDNFREEMNAKLKRTG